MSDNIKYEEFYRCHYRNNFHGGIDIFAELYLSVKETKHGYWIIPADCKNMFHSTSPHVVSFSEFKGGIVKYCATRYIPLKWISKTSDKKFAHPHMAGALRSLKKRCEARKSILEEQLSLTTSVLREIDTNVQLVNTIGDGKSHILKIPYNAKNSVAFF